jgi:hypothetical protein
MPFSVQANTDDHGLSVTTGTAKEAFARAIEWHVVKGFTNISVNDGVRSYSIAEFSLVMALLEIANTAEAAAEQGPKRGK